MTKTKLLSALAGFLSFAAGHSQDSRGNASLALYTGLINYQGDLKPNSFTFQHSNFSAGLLLRKPLNRWITLRAGIQVGKLEGADRYNRDYLQPRNLSFYTSIKEANAGFELTALDISTNFFTPYIYAGIAVFHFNPWTYDKEGHKVFLKPLSTEGQGLPQYPEQKPYSLTQLAIPFGIGARFTISEDIIIGVEFSQRKSFTDYIDDVSSHYVDRETLLLARGAQAVALAYRGGEIPGGPASYPAHGEQRGTPSEMDWYYFFGTSIEMKFSSIAKLLHGRQGHQMSFQQKCPRNIAFW